MRPVCSCVQSKLLLQTCDVLCTGIYISIWFTQQMFLQYGSVIMNKHNDYVLYKCYICI